MLSLPGWRDNPYVSTSVSAADIGPRQGIMSTDYRGVSGWTVVTLVRQTWPEAGENMYSHPASDR